MLPTQKFCSAHGCSCCALVCSSHCWQLVLHGGGSAGIWRVGFGDQWLEPAVKSRQRLTLQLCSVMRGHPSWASSWWIYAKISPWSSPVELENFVGKEQVSVILTSRPKVLVILLYVTCEKRGSSTASHSLLGVKDKMCSLKSLAKNMVWSNKQTDNSMQPGFHRHLNELKISH